MRINDITIIGGGIIGITTAVHLREIGYRTTLITALRADNSSLRSGYPQFASLFPPACILPHSIEMTDLVEVFAISQERFSKLAHVPEAGVRWQQHYELFEAIGAEEPEYANVLVGYAPYGSDRDHLRFDRGSGSHVTGWVSEMLFAEIPTYVPYLYKRYLDQGGIIAEQCLSKEDVANIRSDCVVNCTGLWARELFNDRDLYPVRGHLLLVLDAPVPFTPNGKLFSYTFKVPDSEYPYDLYFFARSKSSPPGARGWLLGGSRTAADPDKGEPWQFDPTPFEMVDGVPRIIFDVNRAILHRITNGTDLAAYPRQSYVGYRPARRGGVRLEAAEEFGRILIHNYGHGGAGVAMSWGCAMKVEQLISTL